MRSSGSAVLTVARASHDRGSERCRGNANHELEGCKTQLRGLIQQHDGDAGALFGEEGARGIHAHAPAGHLGHLPGCRQAGAENDIGNRLTRWLVVSLEQAERNALAKQRVQREAAAVVADMQFQLIIVPFAR